MEQVIVMSSPQWGMMQTRHKAQRLLPGYKAAKVAEVTDHGKDFADD